MKPFRHNPYVGIGIALIVANVLPGLVLWAMLATVIGESRLEGPGADLSWLGTAVLWAGPAIGLLLVLFGRPIARVAPPLGLLAPLLSLALAIGGTILGVLTAGDTSGGANIGGGLMLLFCPWWALMSAVWLGSSVWARRRPA